MRVSHVVSAAVAIGGLALSANAQVLDFQHLEHNDGQTTNAGNIVSEDGFDITKNQGEPFEFATFGTQESRYPGSTALFNNTVNGLIHIAAADGSSFDVESIDFACLNSSTTVLMHLVGNKTGGGQVTQTITHTDPGGGLPLDLVTYNLVGFTGLDSIEWTQESPFHQFDNVVISQGGYRCSVTGQCPGTVRVAWTGATPNRQQGIVFGNSQGSTTIPNGACQGTQLGIQGQVRLVNIVGTGSGSGSVNGPAGTSACGHFIQLVESGSCNTSTVAQIPQ